MRPLTLALLFTSLSFADTDLALQLHIPGVASTATELPTLRLILVERQKASDLAPNDPQAIFQLAQIQNALARFSADPSEQATYAALASQNFHEAIARQPDNPAFHFELALKDVITINQAVIKMGGGKLSAEFTNTANEAVSESETLLQFQTTRESLMLASIAHRRRESLSEWNDAAKKDHLRSEELGARYEAQFGEEHRMEDSTNLLNPVVDLLDWSKRTPPNAAAVPYPPPPHPLHRSPAGPQRIGGNVMQANLLKRVNPVYPPLAMSAGIEGIVEFTVLIDTAGHVTNAQLVRGHPLLVPAAKEALMQWQYRPTLLNGEPVAVITDVMLIFSLSK
jgi:TonB family protein